MMKQPAGIHSKLVYKCGAQYKITQQTDAECQELCSTACETCTTLQHTKLVLSIEFKNYKWPILSQKSKIDGKLTYCLLSIGKVYPL